MSEDKELIEVVVKSDSPQAMAVREAMEAAATKALDDLKVEGGYRHMLLTVALTDLVWRSGSINPQIVTMATSTLMNMAVDAGLGEAIGMKVIGATTETMQ